MISHESLTMQNEITIENSMGFYIHVWGRRECQFTTEDELLKQDCLRTVCHVNPLAGAYSLTESTFCLPRVISGVKD